MGSLTTSTLGNAKPKSTGGILWAPLGTAVPTDASTEFGPEFIRLAYVTEEGLQPEGERSTNAIKDWAGDIIAQLQSEHSSRFSFGLFNAFDPDVLRAAFGADAVTVTGPGKYKVVESGDPLPHGVWGFDMIADGGKKLRIVVEDGQPSTVTERPMVAADLQGFNLTVEAFKKDGAKSTRYYELAAAGAPAIASHTPASLAVAGGTLVTLTGSNFTGATAVTFGGTAATSFTVVSDTKIVASAPAKTAGSVNAIVTTPAGASVAHSVTYA